MALTKKKKTDLIGKLVDGVDFDTAVSELEVDSSEALTVVDEVSVATAEARKSKASRLLRLQSQRTAIVDALAKIDEQIAAVEAEMAEPEPEPEAEAKDEGIAVKAKPAARSE